MTWRAHCIRLIAAAVLLQRSAISAPAPKRELLPLSSPKTALVPFDVSPFPYDGEVPEKNRRFLDVLDGERRGYSSARSGTYWEDETLSRFQSKRHRGFVTLCEP